MEALVLLLLLACSSQAKVREGCLVETASMGLAIR